MAWLPLTLSYFLSEEPKELQTIHTHAYPLPIELQWANYFINLRRPKRESL
jgi:hypothetical protein